MHLGVQLFKKGRLLGVQMLKKGVQLFKSQNL